MDDVVSLILNYNNYQDSFECIAALKQFDPLAKIVVVDNASTNDSVEQLLGFCKDYKNITVMQNKTNEGYAKGNNFGFRFIAQEMPDIKYIVVMNPDTRVRSEKTLPRLRNVLEGEDRLGIVGPITLNYGEVNYYSAWPRNTRWSILWEHCRLNRGQRKKYLDEGSSGVVPVEVVHGCFFMIKVEALKAIGFMDEGTFLYCEEDLLSKDLLEAGYTEAILADEFVEHNHRNLKNVTLRWRIFDELNHYESRKRYSEKYFDIVTTFLLTLITGMNLAMMLPVHVIYKVRLLIEKKP